MNILVLLFNFNGRLTCAISERIAYARKAMFGFNAKAVRLQLPPDIQIDLFDRGVYFPIFYPPLGVGNLEENRFNDKIKEI